MKPRGIPEVPLTGWPSNQHRDLIINLREQLLQLRQRQAVPDAPTNLKGTAQAFSALIQFTRSADADYYEVLHAIKPNLTDPSVTSVDIGNSASWVHQVGNVGIANFYWVRARKTTGASSLEVGPIAVTTLGSAAGVTPPAPPPPANILVLDKSTGRVIPYELAGPRNLNHV